jgi:hypothetical protein
MVVFYGISEMLQLNHPAISALCHPSAGCAGQALQLLAHMVIGTSCACCLNSAERQQLAAVNKLHRMDGLKQAAVVAAGAIPVLVQLVMRGSQAMEEAALEALLTLAAADAIASGGGKQASGAPAAGAPCCGTFSGGSHRG